MGGMKIESPFIMKNPYSSNVSSRMGHKIIANFVEIAEVQRETNAKYTSRVALNFAIFIFNGRAKSF